MSVQFLTLADCRLAYQRQVDDNKKPGVIFLGGYASDMTGTKAGFLAERCAAHSISFIRFDYRGCGQSPGKFTDGTIGAWLEDSLAVFDQLTLGPQLIVGSSMGGWLGLLLAKARPERVKAFIGVAAAPDFTEDLAWEKLTKIQREVLLREGEIYEDGAPDDGGSRGCAQRSAVAPNDRRVPMTLKLIEEGRKHLVLRSPLPISCPVRLLQGMKDAEVPWDYAERIAAHVEQDDVRVTLIKNGDHRLSTPADMGLLWQTVAEFL